MIRSEIFLAGAMLSAALTNISPGELVRRPQHPLVIVDIGGSRYGYLYGKATFKPLGGIYWQVHLPTPMHAGCAARLKFERVVESNKLMPSAMCHTTLVNRIAGRMQAAGVSLLKYRIVEYSLRWNSQMANLHIREEPSKLPLTLQGQPWECDPKGLIQGF